jgi:putative intracellular protease/amidase
LASIKGGEIPLDKASLAGDFYVAPSKKFMEDDDAQSKLQKSIAIADIDFSTVDAVYLAGGHGTCTDFHSDKTLISGVEKLYKDGKIVSAVCHGVMGLVNCKKADGTTPLVKDLKVSAFSDSEEKAVGLTEKVPFLLETKMKELGAKYEVADDWNPKICIDGNLYTGQNPQSSELLAQAVVKALA